MDTDSSMEGTKKSVPWYLLRDTVNAYEDAIDTLIRLLEAEGYQINIDPYGTAYLVDEKGETVWLDNAGDKGRDILKTLGGE